MGIYRKLTKNFACAKIMPCSGTRVQSTAGLISPRVYQSVHAERVADLGLLKFSKAFTVTNRGGELTRVAVQITTSNLRIDL